ncbi:SRPBCC domain-containing protein [Undibacterium arcticum]
MRKYWCGLNADCPGNVNLSDWRPGSRWEHQRLDDARTVNIVGKVVESTPPRRLVFTWARPNDAEDESKHSRVAFDIEPHSDGLVRLTVTHEDLERDPPRCSRAYRAAGRRFFRISRRCSKPVARSQGHLRQTEEEGKSESGAARRVALRIGLTMVDTERTIYISP